MQIVRLAYTQSPCHLGFLYSGLHRQAEGKKNGLVFLQKQRASKPERLSDWPKVTQHSMSSWET